MQTIYKYEIDNSILMPAGAEILHVGEQLMLGRMAMFVWAKVETDAPIVGRALSVVGTGWPNLTHEVRGKHVGTVQRRSGEVYHVFDAGEEQP